MKPKPKAERKARKQTSDALSRLAAQVLSQDGTKGRR